MTSKGTHPVKETPRGLASGSPFFPLALLGLIGFAFCRRIEGGHSQREGGLLGGDERDFGERSVRVGTLSGYLSNRSFLRNEHVN
jgi:hypothetical protein